MICFVSQQAGFLCFLLTFVVELIILLLATDALSSINSAYHGRTGLTNLSIYIVSVIGSSDIETHFCALDFCLIEYCVRVFTSRYINKGLIMWCKKVRGCGFDPLPRLPIVVITFFVSFSVFFMFDTVSRKKYLFNFLKLLYENWSNKR